MSRRDRAGARDADVQEEMLQRLQQGLPADHATGRGVWRAASSWLKPAPELLRPRYVSASYVNPFVPLLTQEPADDGGSWMDDLDAVSEEGKAPAASASQFTGRGFSNRGTRRQESSVFGQSPTSPLSQEDGAEMFALDVPADGPASYAVETENDGASSSSGKPAGVQRHP